MSRLENRGNGSWRLTLSGGYDREGRQIRVTRTIHVNPASTESAQRRQAEREAALIEADYRRHVITDARRISVQSLYEDYIQDRVIRHGLAPRTVSSYQKLFEDRILPFFGKRFVQDLTAKDVNQFLRRLSEDHLSGTYSLKFYQQLHEMLRYAVRMGYITVNPCDLVEPPRRDTKESQFYEQHECVQILKALENAPLEWRLYFTLAIYTGMRPGELTALNWSDISGSVLSVSAGSVQLKGEKTLRTDKPKTKKSVRKIALPPDAVALLNAWRTAQGKYRLRFGAAWPDPDVIFTSDLGSRVSLYTPSRNWKKFTRENGIRPLPLYALRHTNATLMISQGLNVRDVSARLGHSQASTTLNVYAHSFEDANQRATDAVVAALSGVC